MPGTEEAHSGGRSLREIARQPVFVVAVLAAALGYGVMNLLMTATPIAMAFCEYPFATAAFVIQWHVLGMYGPGFFTGHLIRRFGVLSVIVAGVGVMGSGVATALAGTTIAHFWVALFLIGVGWNFMYTGGTTLVTEAYRPAEKAKTQGMNDFFVFGTMALSSFSSGALVNAAGWERMNVLALPFLALVAIAALLLMGTRGRARPA
jgi:MFS family permease